MKKIAFCATMFLLMLFILQVHLNLVNAQENLRQRHNVMLIVNNIAHTGYDEKLTKIIDERLHKKIDGIYNEVVSNDYLPKFVGQSRENVSIQEVLELIKNSSADYLVYTELQPFDSNANYNLVYYDKAMTASFVIRIIDVKNSKELYHDKYIMKAKDTTDYWFIGGGSVAKMALDSVLFKAGEAISIHLPL